MQFSIEVNLVQCKSHALAQFFFEFEKQTDKPLFFFDNNAPGEFVSFPRPPFIYNGV